MHRCRSLYMLGMSTPPQREFKGNYRKCGTRKCTLESQGARSVPASAQYAPARSMLVIALFALSTTAIAAAPKSPISFPGTTHRQHTSHICPIYRTKSQTRSSMRITRSSMPAGARATTRTPYIHARDLRVQRKHTGKSKGARDAEFNLLENYLLGTIRRCRNLRVHPLKLRHVRVHSRRSRDDT